MQNQNGPIPLKEILSEDALTKYLGLSPEKAPATLRSWRSRGLPFILAGKNVRLYLAQDVADWLLAQRKRSEP